MAGYRFMIMRTDWQPYTPKFPLEENDQLIVEQSEGRVRSDRVCFGGISDDCVCCGGGTYHRETGKHVLAYMGTIIFVRRAES